MASIPPTPRRNLKARAAVAANSNLRTQNAMSKHYAPHYALTLRHWVSQLEAQRKVAMNHVSEAIYRIWRLYMAGSAAQLEQGAIGVYQILAANRQDGLVGLPLTRRDLHQ
jgi:cyclopropane fatty-acyl-phospholipid synthase-like methyltransferase